MYQINLAIETSKFAWEQKFDKALSKIHFSVYVRLWWKLEAIIKVFEINLHETKHENWLVHSATRSSISGAKRKGIFLETLIIFNHFKPKKTLFLGIFIWKIVKNSHILVVFVAKNIKNWWKFKNQYLLINAANWPSCSTVSWCVELDEWSFPFLWFYDTFLYPHFTIKKQS